MFCAIDRSRLDLILFTRRYGILWIFCALFLTVIVSKTGVILDLDIFYSWHPIDLDFYLFILSCGSRILRFCLIWGLMELYHLTSTFWRSCGSIILYFSFYYWIIWTLDVKLLICGALKTNRHNIFVSFYMAQCNCLPWHRIRMSIEEKHDFTVFFFFKLTSS